VGKWPVGVPDSSQARLGLTQTCLPEHKARTPAGRGARLAKEMQIQIFFLKRFHIGRAYSFL